MVDIDLIQQGELSENAQRVDLLPTEAIQLAEVIAEAEKRRAKGRQTEAGKHHGRGQIGSGNLPEPIKGRTRDAIGAAVGMSDKTYEVAKAVVEAAKEDPGAYGDLPAMMGFIGQPNRTRYRGILATLAACLAGCPRKTQQEIADDAGMTRETLATNSSFTERCLISTKLNNPPRITRVMPMSSSNGVTSYDFTSDLANHK